LTPADVCNAAYALLAERADAQDRNAAIVWAVLAAADRTKERAPESTRDALDAALLEPVGADALAQAELLNFLRG